MGGLLFTLEGTTLTKYFLGKTLCWQNNKKDWALKIFKSCEPNKTTQTLCFKLSCRILQAWDMSELIIEVNFNCPCFSLLNIYSPSHILVQPGVYHTSFVSETVLCCRWLSAKRQTLLRNVSGSLESSYFTWNTKMITIKHSICHKERMHKVL